MSAVLEGRTALVLGADGRLGNAIARSVGRAGGRLILAARNVPRLEELRGELESAGVEAFVMPTDVTDDGAVQSLVERASGLGMDIAVNNAGATHMPALLGDLPSGMPTGCSGSHCGG
ncbi:SDR family NAD(P)-dependent oxidoreductase [Acidipropionibacterium virtanenii]|uniref:Fatty acyl-CoA reductase n=1 Tax=Acidipropionibacterium virtanenii TaxID=2057246 RepID=A0A344USY8_9ACTN|nr:SDR family NAD(P)-dependent oxidoreductase [Acidipropionibacterium virtanenii]AXE38386.1 Fatty acyl-CoA reductase [Acidipropionibacterium virtanenii]